MEFVFLQERGEDFVDALTDVFLALGGDQVIEGRAFFDGEIGVPLSFVPIRDVLEEQQSEHIVLVTRRLHAATKLVRGPPQ